MAAKHSKSEKRSKHIQHVSSGTVKLVSASGKFVTVTPAVGTAWCVRDASLGAFGRTHDHGWRSGEHVIPSGYHLLLHSQTPSGHPVIKAVEVSAAQFQADGLSIASIKFGQGGGLEIIGTLPEDVALNHKRSHHIQHALMTAAVNAGSWIDDIDLDYVPNGESTGPRSSVQEQPAGTGRTYRT